MTPLPQPRRERNCFLMGVEERVRLFPDGPVHSPKNCAGSRGCAVLKVLHSCDGTTGCIETGVV